MGDFLSIRHKCAKLRKTGTEALGLWARGGSVGAFLRENAGWWELFAEGTTAALGRRNLAA